jgi:hypothetical protein
MPGRMLVARHHENTERKMIFRLIACTLVATVYSGAAFAQAAPARAAKAPAIQAPVDYRQLRSTDAPAGKYDWHEDEPKKTADDIRLERALRGVCRGC